MLITESDHNLAVVQKGILNQLRTLLADEVVQTLLTLGTVVGLRGEFEESGATEGRETKKCPLQRRSLLQQLSCYR
jgi:hypothetical protein